MFTLRGKLVAGLGPAHGALFAIVSPPTTLAAGDAAETDA